ncbi:molecular chaperone [Erythrobacter sp. QSSC1-22B]|uniref:ATP12 family chaperone protein n=1 Tax=Erythrobacter sp. QSSC1-22B TaxID=1860125 RepID=UPI0008055A4C|nr:ATP12 family protein [Erythrobacter sp. QSSC1-22B]OBX19156.1 molecular chaperone [Erythrobacter sp. QSSC1-22B]
MKRFYSEVSITGETDGWTVRLDGRAIKTQGGQPQLLPTPAIAELLAAEWRDQGETLDPKRFVHRDLADYAIDMVARDPDPVRDNLLAYVETDTLCYRADPDEPFWRRQQQQWEPLVAGFEAREQVVLERVSGVIHRPQRPETLAALRERLGRFTPFELAALETLTSLAASLCVGLSVLDAEADAQALWDAANLEEDWQIENWGADEEAQERRVLRTGQFLAALDFARAAAID